MKRMLSMWALLTMLITSGDAQDTVRVYKGWNIIGSLGSGAALDVLVTRPPGIITTKMYGFTPGGGYQSLDTVKKGLGYWVKVSEDGLIIFGDSGSCSASTVEYSGKIYNTVQIGHQCWLKENLSVGVMIQGIDTSLNNGTIEKYCYSDIPANCETYGGLYQWDEAMQYTSAPGGQGICPPGWHIPTYAEFQTLSSTVGDSGNALKAIGQGMPPFGEGTNTSGFSALIAGYLFVEGYFDGLDYWAYFWSSTVADTRAYHFQLYNGTNAVNYDILNWRFGFSVRCLED
jgi:uncharacterized protein (TIGR02145 family)